MGQSRDPGQEADTSDKLLEEEDTGRHQQGGNPLLEEDMAGADVEAVVQTGLVGAAAQNGPVQAVGQTVPEAVHSKAEDTELPPAVAVKDLQAAEADRAHRAEDSSMVAEGRHLLVVEDKPLAEEDKPLVEVGKHLVEAGKPLVEEDKPLVEHTRHQGGGKPREEVLVGTQLGCLLGLHTEVGA